MPTRVQNFLSAMLGALVVAVAFGALAVGGAFDSADDGDATVTVERESSASSGSSPATPVRNATDVSALYERVKDSVAYIAVRSSSSGGVNPFGGGQQSGSGSGFVLDDDGYIVTNQHVVDNASQVQVRLGEGDDAINAKVVGSDASTDLAVIKVDPKDVEGGLKPLELGEAKALKVGQPTVAIGSPFGLSGTLTTGVVSALGRQIESPNGFSIDGVVQTDAAINPGNSGGPLLNGSGQVIGVNAQIASSGAASNSGVGFAIPVDTVREVVPQLKSGKEIRRAYLGVSTGESQDGKKVVIAELVPGGPSADADLRVGDEVVSVGGKQISTPEEIAEAIADKRPGQNVQIVVTRDGERKTVNVKLGTRPESAQRQGG
ncbi:trypsin-like peptidase domain-containing protein [Svornostia abyssi]|uniref:Trypsin-like peptidase domain-containing protein n=1 Tax=Svornostia abyssi TaxID=2898438 RepID=A0ABY5PHR8_9ACTN|nr:trypsin-like peptidase domain-containing protein [Parviterribacteraceae bacterium J379]